MIKPEYVNFITVTGNNVTKEGFIAFANSFPEFKFTIDEKGKPGQELRPEAELKTFPVANIILTEYNFRRLYSAIGETIKEIDAANNATFTENANE